MHEQTTSFLVCAYQPPHPLLRQTRMASAKWSYALMQLVRNSFGLVGARNGMRRLRNVAFRWWWWRWWCFRLW